MNGTIYDELKKNGDLKKREKLKFAIAIISTNLLVALLCLSSGKAPLVTSEIVVVSKRLHPNFKMVIIPLTVLVAPEANASETPVSLMTKSKKILIEKAYLHEEVKKADQSSDTATHFKIEISESDLIKLSADKEIEMIAIPEIKIPQKSLNTSNKRVSNYEVIL